MECIIISPSHYSTSEEFLIEFLIHEFDISLSAHLIYSKLARFGYNIIIFRVLARS